MKQLTLLFLLLSVIAGVQSADKGLNEACTSSDNCVHPTLQLACSVGYCLIKDGQACIGADNILCVAGAECVSNQCTCKNPTYTASSGLCNVADNKWAGACPGGGSCDAASNLVCTDTKCLCSPDFAPNLVDGTCSTAIADAKVGKVCANDDKTTTCGDASTHLECPSGGGKCSCQTGYTGRPGGDCTIANEKIGAACTNDDKDTTCGTTKHLECPSGGGQCTCVEGYTGPVAGDCAIANEKIGATCTNADKNTTCGTTKHLECPSAGGHCACVDGYTGPVAGDCTIANEKIGAACTNDDKDTTCGTTKHLECPSGGGQCTCVEGYTGPVAGDCAVIPNEKIGATCTKDNKDTTCGTTKHLECPSAGGHCACVDGYTGPIGGDCSPVSAAIEVIGSTLTVMLLATVTLLYTF